jgi:hypothetical protein
MVTALMTRGVPTDRCIGWHLDVYVRRQSGELGTQRDRYDAHLDR